MSGGGGKISFHCCVSLIKKMSVGMVRKARIKFEKGSIDQIS